MSEEQVLWNGIKRSESTGMSRRRHGMPCICPEAAPSWGGSPFGSSPSQLRPFSCAPTSKAGMRRPQKQQQAATMPSKALRLGSGCAGSGRALLGASAGLLGSARFHHSVQHYVGRPLAPRGAILQRHGLAPPRRVHRTGAVSREEAKKADPATRPLCELVALPLHFFHAMCDNDGYFGASVRLNLRPATGRPELCKRTALFGMNLACR